MTPFILTITQCAIYFQIQRREVVFELRYKKEKNSESTMQTNRTKPNILVTGTPGTGKTTLSQNLAQSLGMNHIEVGKLVKEKELHDGWDEEFQSYLLNEDKVKLIVSFLSREGM